MKVKIELQENLMEPYAVIYTEELTDQISKVAKILGAETKEDFLILEQNEKYLVMKPEEIFMVRFEENQVVLYGDKNKYHSRHRLYEVEQQLGSLFMRISKTTLINLKQIESVEPSLSGTMYLKLKNGCKDYISRKYLPAFKSYLGI